MVKRTKKDVRRMAQRTTIDPSDNTSEFGKAILDGVSDSRYRRFREHGWIDASNNLSKRAKAVLLRWSELQDPEATLKEEGAPKFLRRSEELYEPGSDELRDTEYKGLEILESEHDQIPSGHENYYSREVRANKTDVELACRALQHGNHLLLKGETGTGKTELAHHIGGQTNRPTWQVNFSGETRIQHLLGHHEVYEGDDGGTEMRWVDGVLTRAVKEGGIFVADEINAADGKTTMMLHSVTEKGDATLTIPELGEVVDVHEDFRLVGTMNPRYAGTNQQNRAFETRFFHLNIDYLPPQKEKNLIMDWTDADEDMEGDVGAVVDLVHELRDDYKKGDIATPITPREISRVVEMMKGGWMNKTQATKTVLLEKASQEDKAPMEKVIEKCI